LFGYDSQVATNVPDPESGDKFRAIGTRASIEVVDAVLSGHKFSVKSNLLGQTYLSVYVPLYDYQARPVGIAFVGKPESEVLSLLNNLSMYGFGLGGGVLLLTGCAALGFSSILSRPIRLLSDFAERVRDGERETQLDWTWRQDEVGVLTRRLNWMSETISNNEAMLRSQSRMHRESAEINQMFASIPLRIRASFIVSDILQTAVEEVQQALKTGRVLIYRLDDSNCNWSGFIAAQALAPGKSEVLGVEIKTDRVHSRHRDTLSRSFMDETIYQSSLLECEIRTEGAVFAADMVAPIWVDSQLFGLLICHDYSGRTRQQLEIDLFRHLATQTGVTLEQASLLEQVEQARIADEMARIEQREYQGNLQVQLINLLSDIEGASNGDLTVRAEVTDGEIGTVADIFNAIVESLRSLVTSVKQAANQVNVSVGENDGAIRHLVDEASIQASDMKSAVRSIEQMQRSLQAVADNASVAAVAALKASSTVEAIDVTIDYAVQNSLILRETVTATANSVLRLGESSQQIDQAMFSLNQIAQQTNVLAINASIEAARAGECGRGFGVVAEGVVKLSAQSAAATREIEQIVENIQRDTSVVAKAMELGTTQVSEVGNKIEAAKKSLARIKDICHQVEHLAQSNSTATGTQAQIFELLCNLMNRIDSESDRQIVSIRQLANSSLESVEIVQHLNLAVEAFKI